MNKSNKLTAAEAKYKALCYTRMLLNFHWWDLSTRSISAPEYRPHLEVIGALRDDYDRQINQHLKRCSTLTVDNMTRIANDAFAELEAWARDFGTPLHKMTPEREDELRMNCEGCGTRRF